MTVYGRHGNFIRVLYLIGAIIWYLLTIGGRLGRKKIVVLCYHGILTAQKWRFEQQMIQISRRFRRVRITFDDAFENLLDNALPLLNTLGIRVNIFAVSENLGHVPKWNIAREHPDYIEKTMTVEQIRDIQSDLISIGSHTQNHPDLSKLPPEQVQWELIESKNNLEQLLGKPVEDLALPHGAYNEEVLRIAQEAGYKRVYTLEPKLVNENQETGVIGRFSMSPDVWPIEFHLTCCGAYSWLHLFRRSVRFLRGLAASGFHVLI